MGPARMTGDHPSPEFRHDSRVHFILDTVVVEAQQVSLWPIEQADLLGVARLANSKSAIRHWAEIVLGRTQFPVSIDMGMGKAMRYWKVPA